MFFHLVTGSFSTYYPPVINLSGGKIALVSFDQFLWTFPQKIENLDRLVSLTQLYVGKNKITKLENLDHLSNLTILSIQSNRLRKIEGLEKLASLEQLYLSHNGIEKIENLDKNSALTTLDVANNMISALTNVSHLARLEEFWVIKFNQIHTYICIHKNQKRKQRPEC